MTEQPDLKARLRRAAAICPWRVGQPAPMLNEAADRITDLEAERVEGFGGLTRVQQIDIERHVRGLSEGPDTYNAPRHGWTCFHCGETFKTEGGARLHFGEKVTGRPQCCTVPPGRCLISTDEWNALKAAESRLALAEKVVEAGMDLQAATNTSRTWSALEAQAWEALSAALTAYEENTSSKDLTTGEDDA